MLTLTLRLNNLVVTINPSAKPSTVLRDGDSINFDVDGRAPLDVAHEMKSSAQQLVISGNITLMMLVCALMAANINIKPNALGIIHRASGNKFKSWTGTLTQALAGDTDKLRFILQQLVVPTTQVVVNPRSRRASGGRIEVGISA